MENKPRYIVRLENGQYRDATETEIEMNQHVNIELRELRKIERKIKDIESNCKHVVVYDMPGYLYDVRVCLACGSIVDFI